MAMPGSVFFGCTAGLAGFCGAGSALATSATSSASSTPPPKNAASRPPDLRLPPVKLAISMFGVPALLRVL